MVRRMLVATTRSSKAFYRRWVEDAGCWWSEIMAGKDSIKGMKRKCKGQDRWDRHYPHEN
uniref:Uncharacterized protein n=1 Tax=Oryza glumipatula TaxID=40148 RepID=A0A0E0AAK5_9ORYZ